MRNLLRASQFRRQLTVSLQGNTRVGLEALSRLPHLRHLYFCTVNASEAERRRLQLQCMQLLPNLQRADNYYAERSDHNGVFALAADSELQLEHVSLSHALAAEAPPTCRLANVRSLQLIETQFARPPAVLLAAFAHVTTLNACELDGGVLRQVLAALGGRLTHLTLHEQQCRSLAEVFYLCPQLEHFHSSFCSFGPCHAIPAASLGRLRHLELQFERENFLAGVGKALLQLLQAPQLGHLHFFGLDLQAEELRPIVRLLTRGAILTLLNTFAVFKRKVNVHGRSLVDNIIVHCPQLNKFHSY
jgi:hypothetical protein